MAVACGEISLSRCTSLRSLTLRHYNPVSPTVLELLSNVPSTTIHTLTLGTLAGKNTCNLPDFTPLAGYLPTGLEKLEVLCGESLPLASVREKLRLELPKFFDRIALNTVRLESWIFY